jgi:M6 family metalloprotease-like protein
MMRTYSRYLLVLLLILCLPGLLSCNRSRKADDTDTSAPISRESPPGGSETAAKLGLYTTEAVGHIDYVVILADFPDVERGIDKATIDERMVWFLGEYFKYASYEKLEYEGTVVGPYTLPKSVEEYKISPLNFEVDHSRVHALVNDVINLADDDVEFSEDLYVMISLGATGADYGMVGYCAIPGMLGFATDRPLTTQSGEVVANAVVFCETAHLGTYIHDTLHMLGGVVDGRRMTPCLYDHELQAKYSGGENMGKIAVNIGFWDPLSSHFPHDWTLPPTGLTSWTKMRLGWIDEDQIALVFPGETTTIWLDPLVGGKEEILAIKIPLSEQTYYLLENRQAVDSDANLPADGILLLYGDDSVHECLDGEAPLRIIDANPSATYFNDATFDIGEQEYYIDTDNDVAIVLLSKADDLSYEILITTPDEAQAYIND